LARFSSASRRCAQASPSHLVDAHLQQLEYPLLSAHGTGGLVVLPLLPGKLCLLGQVHQSPIVLLLPEMYARPAAAASAANAQPVWFVALA